MNKYILTVIAAAATIFTGSAAEPAALADLKSKDAKVRLKAAESLGNEEDTDAIVSALCVAAGDKDLKVIKAALVSLEKVRPELGKLIITLVIDMTIQLRTTAVSQIGLLGNKGKAAARALAATALANVVPPAADRGGERSNLAATALNTIQKTGFSEEDVAITLANIVGSKADFAIKHPAAQALADWAKMTEGGDKFFFVSMKNLLSNETDKRSIPLACKLLGEYGAGAKKDFAPALEKLKLSSLKQNRDAATEALAAFEK